MYVYIYYLYNMCKYSYVNTYVLAYVYTQRTNKYSLTIQYTRNVLSNVESRLTVVSREAKKKQHACASSDPRDHYSELFTRMAALKF